MGSVADDRWHVRLAPGEVKLLTLEQIDDLFRLDMIDGDTLLRQDGTDQWLPLRVVAGLEDETSSATASAPAPFTHSPSFVPPEPSATGRSAPPPPSAPVRSAPPPPPAPLAAPSAPPPPLPPPSVRPPAVASVPPPAVASVPPPAVANVVAPAFASVAPLPFTPPAPLTRASRVEALLIALAALCGLVLTLQRNGALATLFASAGQAAAYAKLEASLGGPAFGTPRAVDALVSQTRASTSR